MARRSATPLPSIEHTTALDRVDTLVRQRLELEQIYASAPIGLALLDPNLLVLRINDRLADIDGISVEAHIGRSLREIVPQAAGQAEAIRRRFLQGEGPITETYSGTTAAEPGVVRHWQQHWAPIRDPDGGLLG